ncbi:MAG: cytochrome c oxidase assembly protein [Propioniciclava sp.]|uniref:cytochrome c oxidase assembly protein n=1 Tax=Propioniciclava sp. TaxID=2038686 RepID=UPI0039E30BF0
MSSTSPSSSATRRAPSTGALLGVSGAVVAAYVAVWLTGLDLAVRPPLPARIQADDVTGLISLIGDLTARLAALGTLGVLTAIVGFAPKNDDDTLTEAGGRLRGWAGRLAQVWFMASVLNTFANPAYVNGVPIGLTFTPASWWTFVWASPSGLAWLASALVAAGITVACYVSRHWAANLIGLVAGVLALCFVAVTGNVTVGFNHDWATDAAIVGTFTAIPLAAASLGAWLAGDAASVRRYQRLVPPLLAVAAGAHAVITWQQMAGVPLTATPYGLWSLALAAVGVLYGLIWLVRQFWGGRGTSLIAVDIVLAIAFTAITTATNHVPPPRFLEPQNIQVNYLGYEVVLAPTIERLVTLGRPNLLWVCIVVFALGAYAAGVVKAHRLGRRWPLGRSVAWAAAWLLTLFLAVTGLWEYSTVQYSWHMVVHMTVNMLVPVLGVLGAPLALIRAGSASASTHVTLGDAIDSLDSHRLWQFVTSPVVAWLAYVGSLFAVYFTPAFPWLMKYHWAHQLMLLVFMMTGYFFFTLIIGADRTSKQLPHLLKLALVISIMPFHAVFAVGILSSQSLIGADFYQTIAVGWLAGHDALMADQNIAGQASWFLGEIPLFVVIIALASQWFRADSKDAARIDARADSGEDDSLDAYNDMLAELAKRDAERARETVVKRLEP